jgi:hypothetical protein
MVVIDLVDPAEIEKLMTAQQYDDFLKKEKH